MKKSLLKSSTPSLRKSAVHHLVLAVLLMAMATLSGHANAATRTWNVASGNWDVSSNWLPAGVPTFNELCVNNNGTILVPVGVSGTSGDLILGTSGTGALSISGGSVVSNYTYLGMSSNSLGTATVSGGSWNPTFLYIGNMGAGSLNISGGVINGGNATIGDSGSGTAVITGGTWNNSSQLTVGFYGTGSLNISGGTVSSSSGYLGVSTSSNGTASVSSGIWNNSSSLTVAGNGAGTLNLTNSGIVSVSSGTGTLTIAQSAGSVGTLNIGTGGTAGTLNAAVVTGGSGTATVTFNHTGSYSFAPRLTGNLAVKKLGTGTTILSALNTYTGATTVESGRLKLDVDGSIANSSSVSVLPGGIFDTTALGSVTFTMVGSQTFKFTLDPAGNGFAGLLEAASIDISSGVVDFATLGPLDDAVYVIGSYASLTGSHFASVVNLPDGYILDYSYNNGTEIAVTAVPEPSALLLLGLGAAGFVFRRRGHLLPDAALWK